jgi:hypothetical protein
MTLSLELDQTLQQEQSDDSSVLSSSLRSDYVRLIEQLNSIRGSAQVIKQKKKISADAQKVVNTWSNQLKQVKSSNPVLASVKDVIMKERAEAQNGKTEGFTRSISAMTSNTLQPMPTLSSRSCIARDHRPVKGSNPQPIQRSQNRKSTSSL